MITRYVLHLTCTKPDPEGNPRRIQIVYLSAGGSNVIADNRQPTHKITTVMEGDACPITPPNDAHSFIVTPTSYNDWLEKVEKQFPRSQWAKKES